MTAQSEQPPLSVNAEALMRRYSVRIADEVMSRELAEQFLIEARADINTMHGLVDALAEHKQRADGYASLLRELGHGGLLCVEDQQPASS